MSKHAHLPANAFLKVKVGESTQRMHLKDLRSYRRVCQRRVPPLPSYWHCKDSQITQLPPHSHDDDTPLTAMLQEHDL